jgi:hypothetical protein
VVVSSAALAKAVFPALLSEDVTEDENHHLRHVFLDLSNILIGFKQTYTYGSQMNWPKLISLLTRNAAGVRIAVGSAPRGRRDSGEIETVWKILEGSGFKTTIATRNLENKEECVDGFLHGQIYSQKFRSSGKNCTFVIVTGDGNDNGGYSNFPEVVASFGHDVSFSVEVWAWNRSLSANLVKAGSSLGSRFRAQCLDKWDLCRRCQRPSEN